MALSSEVVAREVNGKEAGDLLSSVPDRLEEECNKVTNTMIIVAEEAVEDDALDGETMTNRNAIETHLSTFGLTGS